MANRSRLRVLLPFAALGVAAVLGGCVAYPAYPAYGYGYGYNAPYYGGPYVGVGVGGGWHDGWHDRGWHDGWRR
jgi:hypothetical protein